MAAAGAAAATTATTTETRDIKKRESRSVPKSNAASVAKLRVFIVQRGEFAGGR